jgi:hypothetical protein
LSGSSIEGVRPSTWQRAYRRARGHSWPIDAEVSRPPVCPPGWSIAPPDFVGVGVQRAGTSWWFSLLQQHPLVEGPDRLPKELHFFDRFWQQACDSDTLANYSRFFARPPGRLAGEWTPRYMHDAWVPPLLAKAAPEVKILTILRDPIDRYISGLAFDLSRGAPVHPLIACDAFARGLYGSQLSHLLRFFERERILVLQYEQCVIATQRELGKTFRFLGVDNVAAQQIPASRVVNPTFRSKPQLTPAQTNDLVEAYEDDVLALAQSFPEIDLELWPKFRYLSGTGRPSAIGDSS